MSPPTTQPLALESVSPLPLGPPAQANHRNVPRVRWQPYLLALALPPMLAVGVWWAPASAWLGMLSLLAALALWDSRLPQASPAAGSDAAAQGLAVSAPFSCLTGVLAVSLLALMAWVGWLAQSASYPVALVLGLAVGLLWGTLGMGVAHELLHAPRPTEQLLAWLLLGVVLLPGFAIEHSRGHHPKLGTPSDPATARRGVGFWHFGGHFFYCTTLNAWRRDLLRQRQLRQPGWRSPLNGITAGVALTGLSFFMGQQFALLVAWAAQCAVALLLLALSQYVSYHGVGRHRVGFRLEPVAAHHVWSARPGLARWLLLSPDYNADHHRRPWACHASLRHVPHGLVLPASHLACMALALWPRRWLARIEPLHERTLRRLTGDAKQASALHPPTR